MAWQMYKVGYNKKTEYTAPDGMVTVGQLVWHNK